MESVTELTTIVEDFASFWFKVRVQSCFETTMFDNAGIFLGQSIPQVSCPREEGVLEGFGRCLVFIIGPAGP